LFFIISHWNKIPFCLTVCFPAGTFFKKEYVPQIIYLCSIYKLQKFYSEFFKHKYYKNVKNKKMYFRAAK